MNELIYLMCWLFYLLPQLKYYMIDLEGLYSCMKESMKLVVTENI